MTNTLIILIAICVVGFFLGTKLGKRLRLRMSGTADEIISKDASTPDGAKAYFNTSIANKEKEYQDAYAIYTQMLGKIKTYEEQLRTFQKENMQLDLNINNCIEKNDDDGAKVYLKRQQEVSDKVDIIKNALKDLRERSELQKENVDCLLAELDDLKTEKENAALILETAQTAKSLQVTPGTSSKEEDKMLEKVRDGVRKAKEEADGKKVAYENSTTVQQQRLDKKMKDDEVNRRLQERKAAKNK